MFPVIMTLVGTSAIGIAASAYLLYVDNKIKKEPQYSAVCDISDSVSCTSVAKTGYSHSLGVSNALLGLMYYLAVMVLSYLGMLNLVFIMSVPAILMTVYLAWLMYMKIKKYCIVCSLTHVLNAVIFIISLMIIW